MDKSYYSLSSYINRVQDQSTTDKQLKHALNGDLTVILYTDLIQYTNIYDLFRESDNVVILYPVEAINNGHYVCCIYYRDIDLISYFDPYGGSIQNNIKLASYLRVYDRRMQYKLPELLNGHKVIYNTYEFQSSKDLSISTCGKHCVARCLFKKIIDHKEYYDFLTLDNLTKDQIVSLMFL